MKFICLVARYIQFVVTHVPHLTSAPLREADIHLEMCSIHDVPQNQSPNATHMMGFTQRFVGRYPEVWSDSIWNDFMPEDLEAVQKKQQEEIDACPASSSSSVWPEVFKVDPASSSNEATGSKARPSTLDAVTKKQQEEIVASMGLGPIEWPEVFKLDPASSSNESTASKARPPTRTYGRSVPSKKPRLEEPIVAPKERTPSEIEWDAMVEQEEMMANPDLWTWV